AAVFFLQAEDGIRGRNVTGVQTCALPIFDYFITQDDVSKIKPDPELYLKTLDTLDIKPSEAIVFEDSLNGLLSAQQANIPVVLVPNPVAKHIPFENYFLKLNSMKDKNLTDNINMVSQTKQK